jgi:putative transposase
MRKSKFSDEQIIGILKQAEAGASVTDVCRQHGISGHTFYRWRAKYGGLEVNEARRLKELEDENRELKQMAADLGLQVRALKAALAKKW